MPCYMCKTKTGPFQRLEVARLRFIRKAQPQFKDDSYLCSKCFAQFEAIYKSKSKSKNDSNSSRTSISNSSIRSVSTTTHNSKTSSREGSTATAIQKQDGNNNSDNASAVSVIHFDSRSIDSHNSIDSMDRIVQMAPEFLSLRDSSRKTTKNPELIVARQGADAAVRRNRRGSTTIVTQRVDGNNDSDNATPVSVIHFDSRSIDSPSSSIDSTDRIVQMAPEFLSLRDSSRKTTKNPELIVAQQGAAAAVRSALKRQKILQADNTPLAKPTAARRDLLQIVDEESSEDEDIASQLSPNNLAHVRPVVRRRKEPVVQQFDDIMDLYIARTSGG